MDVEDWRVSKNWRSLFGSSYNEDHKYLGVLFCAPIS